MNTGADRQITQRKRQSALTLDPENGNGRGHHFIPIPGRVKQ